MDRQEYRDKIKRHNTRWLRHGDRTLLGLAKASVEYGKKDHLPTWMIRPFTRVFVDTVLNGELASDFRKGRPLIPIVYCHGLSSNRMVQSGSCRDLASHGYIVFSLDHRDESCNYVETKDGEGLYYNNDHSAYNLGYRQQQLEIREKEIMALIDEISEQTSVIQGHLSF